MQVHLHVELILAGVRAAGAVDRCLPEDLFVEGPRVRMENRCVHAEFDREEMHLVCRSARTS